MHFLVALAMLVSVPALAQDLPDYSGNGLYKWLSEPRQTEKQIWWMGYITGQTEALDALGVICIPKDAMITLQQQSDIVKKWLENHPERRHEAAISVVLESMQDAWPCKKPTKN